MTAMPGPPWESTEVIGSAPTDLRPPTSSWAAIDLSRYLDEPDLPTPTVLARSDGACLFYAGETAWIFGEPGCGKTWTAAYACAQVVQQGEHIVWFDFEGQGASVVQRLLVLGCTREQLELCLHLVEPESAFGGKEDQSALAALAACGPSVVVFDAANDVLTLQGGRLNDVDTIAKFDMMLLLPFKRAGAAVVVIDHVTKNAEGRGLWPINSGHKKACSTVAYAVVSRQQFRPDRDGASQLIVAKDRHGNAPAANGQCAGYLTVTGGKFSLEPTLGLNALAQQAADEGRREAADVAVVVDAVMKKPGELAASALAAQLEKTSGGSTSTWRRRIHAALEADPALIERRGAKLWPTTTEDVEP